MMTETLTAAPYIWGTSPLKDGLNEIYKLEESSWIFDVDEEEKDKDDSQEEGEHDTASTSTCSTTATRAAASMVHTLIVTATSSADRWMHSHRENQLFRRSPYEHRIPKGAKNKFKIFCDLDGVLVDFESGIRKIFPDLFGSDDRFTLQDLEKSLMWTRVQAADAFFEHLPWTRNGKRLWNAIKHLRPKILTGVPSHETSRTEKYNWCRRELMADGSSSSSLKHVDMAGYGNYEHVCVNSNKEEEARCCYSRQEEEKEDDGSLTVITCWSFNKHYESSPGAVLIDDRESLRHDWEARGGIFVHHTEVDSTLVKLRYLGIL